LQIVIDYIGSESPGDLDLILGRNVERIYNLKK